MGRYWIKIKSKIDLIFYYSIQKINHFYSAQNRKKKEKKGREESTYLANRNDRTKEGGRKEGREEITHQN